MRWYQTGLLCPRLGPVARRRGRHPFPRVTARLRYVTEMSPKCHHASPVFYGLGCRRPSIAYLEQSPRRGPRAARICGEEESVVGLLRIRCVDRLEKDGRFELPALHRERVCWRDFVGPVI
jgi:hypothetical protein